MSHQFQSKMICPACKQPTRRTRNSQCVKCKVDLELFEYTLNGENHREFRLKDGVKASQLIQQIESRATVPDVEGRLMTPVGSNPEIILLSQTPKQYKVVYRQIIPTNWVYCPNCQQKMFQNMVVDSGHLPQQVLLCPHCEAGVIFVFITNFAQVGY